jgi:hypothetical protein
MQSETEHFPPGSDVRTVGPLQVRVIHPYEEVELMESLGLPPDCYAMNVRVRDPYQERWRGYVLDVLEVYAPGLSPFEGTAEESTGQQESGPRTGEDEPPDEEPLFWDKRLVKRAQVFCPDTPVYVESLQRPRPLHYRFAGDWGQERLSLRGLEEMREVRDVQRALRGRGLLRETARLREWGRPIGSITIPDFPDRLGEAYRRRLEDFPGRRPLQHDIAGDLGISTPTFGRYLRRFKLRWPPRNY